MMMKRGKLMSIMLKTKSIKFVARESNKELSFIDKTLMRMICLKMEMILH
jgi:hypothetical protein